MVTRNPAADACGTLASPSSRRPAAVSAGIVAALAVAAALPAYADPASDLAALKQQVQELQQRIDALSQQQAAAEAAAKTAAAAPAPAPKPPSTTPSFNAGPMTVTLGGFVDLDVVFRSRNEASDFATNYSTGIPFPQSNNYNLSEFRMTERQSRLAALVQSPSDPAVAAEAYVEADFGAGPRTANWNQTSSFSPRVRHFYADYTRKDSGWYLLFGQTWSLLVPHRKGISPRQELLPLAEDGQYLPGFDFTRAPQIRLVKKFSDAVSAGISVENPAAQIAPNSGCATVPAAVTAVVCNAPAGVFYDPANNITLDASPDVLGKLAFDPGWGHYEVFGVARSFRDRYNGSNTSTTSGAGGGNAVLPLVPGKLEFTGSFLVGDGIGRFGAASLPDVTLKPDRSFAAIRGYHFLAGLSLKPTPELTLYAYGGREHEDKTDYPNTGGNTFLGYGSPLYDNSNCLIEGSTGKCTANTATITQGTLGGW
jgi:hypothetical protein